MRGFPERINGTCFKKKIFLKLKLKINSGRGDEERPRLNTRKVTVSFAGSADGIFGPFPRRALTRGRGRATSAYVSPLGSNNPIKGI